MAGWLVRVVGGPGFGDWRLYTERELIMAAGILSRPGSKLGPCKRCEHIDCRESRAMAAADCRFCQKPIGYGVRYVAARLTGCLAHERCVDDAVTRNDARLGEF